MLSVAVKQVDASRHVGVYVKAGAGELLIVIIFEKVLSHRFAVVTVRLTSFCPEAVYICEGLASVETPPSPKFHDQFVIVSFITDDRSINTAAVSVHNNG